MPTSALRRRQVLAAYVGAILAATLLPVPDLAIEALPKWSDKVVHFVMFAILAGLVYWERLAAGPPRPAFVIGAVAALAALIEVAQGPLPERTGDVGDFVLGVVGAVAGYLLAQAVLEGRG